MSEQRGKREPGRPADIVMGAKVSARRLRFRDKARVETSFPGEGERTSHSSSSRENLPDEVDVGRTYRDVRVDWRLESAAVPEDEAAVGRGVSSPSKRLRDEEA